MDHISKKFKSYYSESLLMIGFHGIFIISLFLGYRIRIFGYIQSMYPDVKLKGFLEYLSLGVHYDAVAIFCTMLLSFALIFLFSRAGKIKFIAPALFSVLLVFFILFSVEFFRVYETTFQKNFTAAEQFTGLGNIFDSARAEFSNEFYVLFLILSTSSAAMHYVLWRQGKNADFSRTGCMASDLPAGRLLWWLMPVLLIVFLSAGIATDAAIPRDKFSQRYEKAKIKKYISLLHEFSMNPVYNLAAADAPVPEADSSRAEKKQGAFSYNLNTDSMATTLVHGSTDAIPRNARYNIILYFFESTPRKYYGIKVKGRHVIQTWHRLEKNSINFRNHYANYPLSANALMSVLASAYDLNSKDMVIQKYPDIKLKTLPEILKDRGYRTCLIHTGGLGYAGQKRFLKNRKFDSIIEYDQLVKIPPYNQQVGWGVDERAMIRPGIEFIKQDPKRPFFMVYLPVNPHHPYAIPNKTFQITGDIPGDADYRKRNWFNYLNSLHYSDAALGLLVDDLERQGLMENTLLFLFADHGEAFYQHKMNYNHPLYLYNENVHVPFLIYNKRIFDSPVYFDGVTRHIDILPTILDILGIPKSPEQEGKPILSSRREQMALLHTSWKDDYVGITDKNWKYICRTRDMMEELYDLDHDPDEKENIAERHIGITERYRAFVMKARKYKDNYYEKILKK